MNSLSKQKSKGAKVARIVASFMVCVVFALGFIAAARYLAGKYAPESQPIVIIAALISLGASGIYLVRTVTLRCHSGKYREPTGKEILSDLVAAAPGLLFSVPFIFVSVTGGLTSTEERVIAAALTFPSIVFPTLRPRKVQSGLNHEILSTATGNSEASAQSSGEAISPIKGKSDGLNALGDTGVK